MPEPFLTRVRSWLPQGQTLPAPSWAPRHRAVLVLLAAHAVGLFLFALYQGMPVGHAAFEGGIVLGLALLAAWPRFDRRLRSTLAAGGLMSSSAVLTHVSGGYIEAHFHFFVMLGVISLYEDWVPFLLSIAYVAVHHGVFGTLDPSSVYNHPAAIAHPWRWAMVHAAFILGLSVANIFTWRVTEQARARATESSARHAAILTSALDAIITIDEAGRVVEFNPAAERMFGYARREALGREMADLVVPPAQREAHRRGLARFRTAGGTLLGRRIEMPAMAKDGRVFPVELAIAATPSGHGLLFTGYLRDLTQQHEAQKELEATRLQLARSEKLTAIGQLVSGVAHEVRTPLTYLNTNLHLLGRQMERVRSRLPKEEQALLENVPERMAEVLEAAERIDRLVEDLRRYSKVKAGVQTQGCLRKAVGDAVGLFAATHRANVKVHADLHETPPFPLDHVHVQQIVLNLLQNAADAMPAGGNVTVHTSVSGDAALLTVEDDGPGIPPEVRGRVFDPFFTTKSDGTGLGLSIVKRLVDEHRATLVLLHPPAGGTRFEIRFPLPAEGKGVRPQDAPLPATAP